MSCYMSLTTSLKKSKNKNKSKKRAEVEPHTPLSNHITGDLNLQKAKNKKNIFEITIITIMRQ